MSIDDAFQMIYKALINRVIKWNDFHEVGVDEYYHDYYYAENEVYVIRDRIFDRLTLIRAKSPKMAWEIFEEDVRSVYGGHDEDDE